MKPGLHDKFLRLLKQIPVDFGQEAVAERTMGKVLAQRLVPTGPACAGRTALDVGCRKGVQSRWLEEQGYQVTAIDIQRDYEKCRVVDVDQGLPFAAAEFDLVWCSEVLEHLAEPSAALAEFLRVTKEGGAIVLTTPNSYFWLFRLFSCFGMPPARLQRQDHRHFFRYADIRALLPEAEICGFFPYLLIKCRITTPLLVAWLSPTLVVRQIKSGTASPTAGGRT